MVVGTEQELSKKLAEYYGVIEKRKVINSGREDEEYEDEAYFLAETGERITFNLVQVGFYAGYPPFTKSLDVCFELLVPEAIKRFGAMAVYFAACGAMYESIEKKEFSLEGAIYDNKPALALCRAIEKFVEVDNLEELSGAVG